MNQFAFMYSCRPVWRRLLIAPACTEQRCNQCSNMKPLTEFHRDRRAKNGRQQPCKECRRG